MTNRRKRTENDPPRDRPDSSYIPLSDLRPDPRNARKHNDRNVGMVRSALEELGAARSIVVDDDGVVLAGNATIRAAKEAGIREVIVVDSDGDALVAVRRRGLSPEQKARLGLLDNRSAELAEWDTEVLSDLLAEMPELANGLWEGPELDALLGGFGDDPGVGATGDPSTLTQRFGVPPFSVLDARQGYWQERKRAWLALGIQSELGRGPSVGDGDEGVAAPGGALMPSASLGADGKTVRGDGKGRTIRRTKTLGAIPGNSDDLLYGYSARKRAAKRKGKA